MFKISRGQRDRPIKAIALVGALWLITLSGIAAYAQKAPIPATAAAASYGPLAPVNATGEPVC